MNAVEPLESEDLHFKPAFRDDCPGRHRYVTIVSGSGVRHQAGARTAVQPCQDPVPETLPGVAGLLQ